MIIKYSLDAKLPSVSLPVKTGDFIFTQFIFEQTDYPKSIMVKGEFKEIPKLLNQPYLLEFDENKKLKTINSQPIEDIFKNFEIKEVPYK